MPISKPSDTGSPTTAYETFRTLEEWPRDKAFSHIWSEQGKLRLGTPALQDPNQWQGQNLLGFALMETRDILRARQQKEPEDQ